MQMVFTILALLISLAGLGCWIIILIDAFQNEIWKGIVCLLCGLYGLYYAFAEFEHEKKWLIVGGAIGSNVLAFILYMLAGASAAASVPH